ncbi:MAG: hypothetical protein EOO88_37010 [Pedobacter sp.]|nr:MAG: hypothetical protein EOO88_37010 [Pedobacter sp.]
MSSFPGSPRLIKGGIVLLNASTSAVEKIITLQYNPDTISRTLQVQGAGDSGGNRSEALRLAGPPVETIKLEAEIDATDKMESGDSQTAEFGIQPQLAVLETLIYPKSSQMNFNNGVAKLGTIEILAMETPLILFIWNKNRIIPVRITEFSVTEEAFDPMLNPIRAKVSLGMRVLSTDDLGFDHKGGNLFMSYQQNKERLAAKFSSGKLQDLGINAIS